MALTYRINAVVALMVISAILQQSLITIVGLVPLDITATRTVLHSLFHQSNVHLEHIGMKYWGRHLLTVTIAQRVIFAMQELLCTKGVLLEHTVLVSHTPRRLVQLVTIVLQTHLLLLHAQKLIIAQQAFRVLFLAIEERIVLCRHSNLFCAHSALKGFQFQTTLMLFFHL
jgi:hypothetical protein